MKLSTNRLEASLLKRALLANAAFSIVCGLLIVVFDEWIVSALTRVDHQLWPLGLMLIGFSASLVWLTTRPSMSPAWVNAVIAADVAWVVGTIVLLVGWSQWFSTSGIWVLTIIAALVLLFAELQWFGLRRLRKSVT